MLTRGTHLRGFLRSRQQGPDARVKAGGALRLRAGTLFPRLADMFARLTRPLLLALLLILPLQSMAAALAPLLCSPQESHHATTLAHASAPSDAPAAHDHALLHEGTGDMHSDDGSGHLCCHHFASATPMFHTLIIPDDFRAHAASVTLLTPLHIPELPQRPPRA